MDVSNIAKVLVFDIWADYAQFKKYFTNMSPLTFAIPPRTVITGILGAIIGIDKKENPETFSKNNSFISLKVNRSIRKVKLPTNYLKTLSREHFSKFKQHKPTNVEYLINPSFRIYVSHQDKNIYEKIKRCLKEHKTTYTLNLGISSCIANFEFIGEFAISQGTESNIGISSIIPKSNVKNIVFENDVMIQQCTLPNIMLNNREVTEYKEFLYEVNGKKMTVEIDNYYFIDKIGENIVGM